MNWYSFFLTWSWRIEVDSDLYEVILSPGDKIMEHLLLTDVWELEIRETLFWSMSIDKEAEHWRICETTIYREKANGK